MIGLEVFPRRGRRSLGTTLSQNFLRRESGTLENCPFGRSPNPQAKPGADDRRATIGLSGRGEEIVVTTSRNFMFILIIQSLIPLPGRLGA